MLSRYPRSALSFLIIFFILAWIHYDSEPNPIDEREPWAYGSLSSTWEEGSRANGAQLQPPVFQRPATQPHPLTLPYPLTPSVPFGEGKTIAEPNSASSDSSNTPSPYAYVFYATTNEYACSVLVNMHRLQKDLHTPHRIFVLVTDTVDEAMIEAMEAANATVSTQVAPQLAKDDVPYYRECLLKMLGFKMHKIDPTLERVLVLDSDQLIINSLDHVFDLPVVDLAAPRAYWLSKDFMTSAFMLITLSDRLWNRVETALENIKPHKFDMDLVNDILGDIVLMLPGSYVALNAHWENWGLPPWFRPEITEENAEEAQTVLDNNQGKDTATNGVTHKLVDDYEEHEPPETLSNGKPVSEVTRTHVVKRAIDSAGLQEQPTESAADKSSPSQGVDQSSSKPSKTADKDEKKPTETKAKAPPPPPRDSTHPNYEALFTLYENATNVLHFSSLGKPWTFPVDQIPNERPRAHPVFQDQFRLWREIAMEVCPPIRSSAWGGKEIEYKIVEVL